MLAASTPSSLSLYPEGNIQIIAEQYRSPVEIGPQSPGVLEMTLRVIVTQI